MTETPPVRAVTSMRWGRCYVYRGDRMTRPDLRGKLCWSLLDDRGKCVRGRNGNMLVYFYGGERVTVLARHLRRVGKGSDTPMRSNTPP